MSLHFAKGNGTQNDFVVLPDPDGALDLTPALVAALCHRTAGIGADGVLRVIRTQRDPEVAAMADEAPWFMDYRNADGSVSEMCGNGLRVFARYLVDGGYAEPGRLLIATRDGAKTVWVEAAGDVTIDMGVPEVLGAGTATLAGEEFEGLRVTTGNPHLVCLMMNPIEALDLSEAPLVDDEQFPAGANVEFVNVVGQSHVRMRVHERGVGETRSCGTGAVAVAAATAWAAGVAAGEFTVDVPGGSLTVRLDGTAYLSGPAVIVAEGEWTGP